MTTLDLLVCGGGPVGLASAIAARLSGLSAAVLERSREVQDKACGEGLMPHGVRALERLGVRLPAGHAITGVRFIDGQRSVAGRFSGRLGRGLPRVELLAALEQRALELGVSVWRGCTLRGLSRGRQLTRVDVRTPTGAQRRLSARLLVGADGLRSPIRRRLGYELPQRHALERQRYGMRQHFRIAPWSDFVEVHFAAGAEAYVTPLGPERVGVALLTYGRPGRFGELLERFHPVCDRLAAGSVPLGRPLGAGPLEQRSRALLAPGVALVGDAAGYRDAITGEGLSIGFGCARALVARFAQGELEHYPADHARLSRPLDRLTQSLLFLARRPRLRRLALDQLARHPALLSDLLSIAAGGEQRATCRSGGLLRWLMAVPGTERV